VLETADLLCPTNRPTSTKSCRSLTAVRRPVGVGLALPFSCSGNDGRVRQAVPLHPHEATWLPHRGYFSELVLEKACWVPRVK
jgi:hypothetical protein